MAEELSGLANECFSALRELEKATCAATEAILSPSKNNEFERLGLAIGRVLEFCAVHESTVKAGVVAAECGKTYWRGRCKIAEKLADGLARDAAGKAVTL